MCVKMLNHFLLLFFLNIQLFLPLMAPGLTCSVLYISLICLPSSFVGHSWCKALCVKWWLQHIHLYYLLSFAGSRVGAAQPDGHRPLTCQQLRRSSAYAIGTHTLCHSFPRASTRVGAHALLRRTAESPKPRERREERLS